MSLPIAYWSDPLCVWAYLAEDKLRELDAVFGDAISLHWRVVPVFGSVPARFHGGVWAAEGRAGRATKTVELAQRFGHTEVHGRVWLDDPPASSWSPAAAFEAVRLLEEEGGAPAGAAGAYLRALRHAFFVEDRNIARREVQEGVARAQGLPESALAAALDDGRAVARVFEAHEERQRLGIQGSPTWVFDGGRAVLYGNVHAGVLRSTVAQLLEGQAPGASRC